MLKYSCCPSLTWVSFTVFITIVDVVIFMITLFVGGITSGNPSTPALFLQVNPLTLYEFGDRYPYYIKYHYQFWRFLTPVFLHAFFLHIFFNSMSQLIFGSMLESLMQTWKLIVLYFMSGIGGNLFGALVSDVPAVGASTAIAGLLGVYIAYIIVNWEILDYDGSPRDMMLCMALLMIMFDLLFATSITGNQVDNFGHLGGLITGIFGGMWLVRPINGRVGSYEKKASRVGWIVVLIYFVLGFTLFFTLRHPSI